jgi:CO/xanthine dehydrogenase Mo-binding subunit
VRIHADGSGTVLTGATELGQGSRTVLAQIAAEELGLAFERVSVVASDTGVTPYERTTGASRTTTVAGRALQAACADARRKVRRLAADSLDLELDQVVDAPGGVVAAGRRLSYAEIIERWFGAAGEVMGTGEVRRAGVFTQMPPFWEVGAGGVVASVDRETGVVSIDRLVTVGDVGLAINPALVEGQDAGAAMMGLGAALREELVYEDGGLVNAGLVDYRVPRFSDMPAEMEHLLAERGDGSGPYGAKGAGEGATNPMGGAVVSAIGRAIGVFPHELPATPERIWRLLKGVDHGKPR